MVTNALGAQKNFEASGNLKRKLQIAAQMCRTFSKLIVSFKYFLGISGYLHIQCAKCPRKMPFVFLKYVAE
jgi:hypothetical protein